MKIIFLGTNGWYSSSTGDTPCILIDAKDQYVIFDAGNGIHKLDKYLTQNKPISMFISHFHLDHVSGLHTLAKFDFEQGIDVYIGAGRSKDFITLVNPPFTIGFRPKSQNIINLKTPIRLHEISNNKEAPFKMAAIEQHHAYKDHGFLIELEGKKIVYTGDCGFTDASRKLAMDAHLLICECSNKKTTTPDVWGHFDPFQAATLARECNVNQLILNHFAADSYLTLDDRKWAEEEAKKIFPRTIAAIDEFIFEM